MVPRQLPRSSERRARRFFALCLDWRSRGRDPGPNFSTLRYLQRYPDLARAGVNPLLHYLEFGMWEEREIFPAEAATQDYYAWIERHERRSKKDHAELRRRVKKLSPQPLISILMPTYNTPVALLREALNSVLAQAYDHWELCIADDASSRSEVLETLAAYVEADGASRSSIGKSRAAFRAPQTLRSRSSPANG